MIAIGVIPQEINDWMISPAGTAAATWASAIIGIAAIIIAVRALLIEKGRTTAARYLREADIRETRADFARICAQLCEVSHGWLGELRMELLDILPAEQLGPDRRAGWRLKLQSFDETFAGLRSASVPDASLVVALSDCAILCRRMHEITLGGTTYGTTGIITAVKIAEPTFENLLDLFQKRRLAYEEEAASLRSLATALG